MTLEGKDIETTEIEIQETSEKETIVTIETIETLEIEETGMIDITDAPDQGQDSVQEIESDTLALDQDPEREITSAEMPLIHQGEKTKKEERVLLHIQALVLQEANPQGRS